MELTDFDVEKIGESIDSYYKKREAAMDMTSSGDYFKWIYDFTEAHESWCDDDFDYKQDEISKECLTKVHNLSYFFDYVEKVAYSQNVIPVCDYGIAYFISIYNQLYKIEIISGQGTFTRILKAENTEGNLVVYIDRELTAGEIEKRKFAHYILLDSSIEDNDVIKYISAVSVMFGNDYLDDKNLYEKWVADGMVLNIIKKDISKMATSDERYCGLIKENDIPKVISFGILNKEIAETYDILK